ncbi:hypothetical protein AC35_5252 [Escherichia coli 3-475-03_S3_C2]|nr:hypothetical protein ECDEC5A_3604 [Escherichia coli DEC5A]EKI03198.1 hypothetical protein EC5905_5899 [Escherichia coli 5905]KDY40667.1 hypothetical protein AC73_3831 [Escherichia coli 2-427-07_S4_C1]KEK78189.1 hypothetical protein AC35_5252 [Escherichia coli 3-475-03_S3_C2]
MQAEWQNPDGYEIDDEFWRMQYPRRRAKTGEVHPHKVQVIQKAYRTI